MNLLREYHASKRLEVPYGANRFYTFLLAAMREADTNNLAKLKEAFPDVFDQLSMRYNAPGGALDPLEMDIAMKMLEL